MTSQKCCCPAVNGWRRLRPLVGELAISWKVILSPKLPAREFQRVKDRKRVTSSP